MTKIIRTPTRVEGGITSAEKLAMGAITAEWTQIAFRTALIDRAKLVPSIEGLYAAAGLKKPRVVIATSPLVMAFAYGAAAWIWHCRKGNTDAATRDATDAATYAATRDATRDATNAATNAATAAATYAATRAATDAATAAATDAATDAATYAATRDATRDATNAATNAATAAATYAATDAATAAATDAATAAAKMCQELSGAGGLHCAKSWWRNYQGGNMWAGFTSYVAAMRDVLGLQLPEFEKYRHWETAAREGGFRVLHPEFCIVSDFPEVFKVDDQSRAHCENGPSHRWRDGWSLYHWHGISIPGEWVTGHPPTASEALNWPNIEQRHAACEIVGWAKILNELEAVVVDEDDDPEIGTLLQCSLPDSGAARFLRVTCGTKRQFVLPVPVEMKTAIEAQAWTWGLDNSKFFRPEVRT